MKLRLPFALLLLAAAFTFVACGAKDAPPPSVPAGTAFSLTFGPVTVQPGEEHTKCLVLRLGNVASIHVGTIHNVLSQGSHHMIVYRSTETVEQTTPIDCQPFTDTLDPSRGSTLMVTQKHDDTLTLPDGVAFTLDPNQMIRMEVHYINPTAAPLEVTATTNVITMDDAQFRDEAGFLFIGDPDITVPAHASFSLGPIFFALPSDYAGVNFFAITGHEHQFGTGVTVSTASSATDPGTSVYDVPGWLWSEPATVVSDPPFTLPSGGGFRFTCNWDNTSDNPVSFGESATNEMCFFWAYYYPSTGSRVCMHSDKYGGPGGIDMCCPGPSLICSIIISKLHDAG
ncbi:MAG TPA: hypothetical protein VIF09_16265 [Polyangiaceae bacterium]